MLAFDSLRKVRDMRFRIAYKLVSSPAMVWCTDLAVRYIYGGKIIHRGNVIDTNGACISPRVRSQIFWHRYETAEQNMVQRYLTKSMDVIELGGSIGVVGSQIGGRLDAGRRFICVEANPRLVEILKRNVEANCPHVATTIVHGAVAYTTPAAHLVGMSFGNSSLAGWINHGAERKAMYQVPCFSLGQLVSQYTVGPFVMVADIEGAEAGIFAYDKGALVHCPLMIVELHETTFEGRRLSIADLISIVVGLGYHLKDCERNVHVFEKTLAL